MALVKRHKLLRAVGPQFDRSATVAENGGPGELLKVFGELMLVERFSRRDIAKL